MCPNDKKTGASGAWEPIKTAINPNKDGSNMPNPQNASKANTGLELIDWNFTLNGNSYHPDKMSRNYTLKRLLPMAHSEGYSDSTS